MHFIVDAHHADGQQPLDGLQHRLPPPPPHHRREKAVSARDDGGRWLNVGRWLRFRRGCVREGEVGEVREAVGHTAGGGYTWIGKWPVKRHLLPNH
jgi:hypothetical protein